MRERYRTITPPHRLAWFHRTSAALNAFIVLATVVLLNFVAEKATAAFLGIFFAACFIWALINVGARIAVGDRTMLIAKNRLSMVVLDRAWISGFEWRHNIHGAGGPSQRLWIVLDDGQNCPTPVTKRGLWFGRDLVVSDDQAEALLAELNRVRKP